MWSLPLCSFLVCVCFLIMYFWYSTDRKLMTTHLNSSEKFHNIWSDHDCKMLPLGLKGKFIVLFYFTKFIYTFTAQPYQHQTGHLKLSQRKISLIKINICYWVKCEVEGDLKRMGRFFCSWNDVHCINRLKIGSKLMLYAYQSFQIKSMIWKLSMHSTNKFCPISCST